MVAHDVCVHAGDLLRYAAEDMIERDALLLYAGAHEIVVLRTDMRKATPAVSVEPSTSLKCVWILAFCAESGG